MDGTLTSGVIGRVKQILPVVPQDENQL